MKKQLSLCLVFLTTFFGLTLFFWNNFVQAQTCGGGITCYQSCRNDCTLACSFDPTRCCGTSSLVCTGLTSNVGCVGATCSFVGNQGICDPNGIVSANNCFVIPPPTPTPPGATPPPSGWGACGSCAGCPGGNNTQCRTDPGGACVWDPSGCGSSATPPPQWETCNAFLPSPSNLSLNVGQTGNISIRLKQGSFSRLAIGLSSGANTISNVLPRNFGGSSLVLDNRYEYRSTTATALSPGINRWTVYLYDTFAGYEIMRCSKSFNVIVSALSTPVPTAPPPAPVVDIQANSSQGPLSVVSGTSVNLSWTASGATSCVASGGWSGSKTASGGSESSSPITSSRTFSLSCTGPGGTTTDSVTCNLQGPPAAPVVTLSAAPSTLPAGGGNSVLTWTSTNSTSCTATGGWSGSKSLNGSESRNGIATDSTFTLTCTGPGGTSSASTTVTVAGVGQCSPAAPRDPATPVCAPNPPVQNGSITWTWPVVPLATEYFFQVVDDTTGNLIAGTQTGWQNGQTFFNCRPNTVDICSIETDLPPGRYRSQIQARNLGPGGCNVSAVATYPNPPAPGIEVDTCNATAWWQVRGSDVVSQGNIQSRIPVSCVGPACIARLIASSTSGSSGGVLLRGSVVDTGAGFVSDSNWDAQISLLGRQPRYADFVSLIPTSVTVSDPGANPSASAITSPPGSSLSGGYYWLRRSGDVRISQAVNIPSGTRVVLFVDGVANIDEDISFANIDNSFFMIVARNGIRVGTNPDTIQGIFYTEGGFDSGTGSNPLQVTGSTTALGGVTLGRDLGIGNRTSPAEVFSLSPELLLNYPQTLTFKRPLWQEVAP
jgi:hypothetical protein